MIKNNQKILIGALMGGLWGMINFYYFIFAAAFESIFATTNEKILFFPAYLTFHLVTISGNAMDSLSIPADHPIAVTIGFALMFGLPVVFGAAVGLLISVLAVYLTNRRDMKSRSK